MVDHLFKSSWKFILTPEVLKLLYDLDFCITVHIVDEEMLTKGMMEEKMKEWLNKNTFQNVM